MTDQRSTALRTTLQALVAVLERLEESGVRTLNIAPLQAQAPLQAHAPLQTQAPPPQAGQPVPGLAEQTGVPLAPQTDPGAAELAGPYAGLESLAALHQHCGDCQLCKLGATRTRIVLGTGHGHPRLMFIGEGPGAEEDAQGLPFVGRAGALLTGLILALGLTREDVFITNVVKCRPPGNRTPEPDEVASCRPILQRQIELLDPALIVTLGNVPLKALNPGAAGITKERGRIFPFQRWNVLPTFHPSYLLRSPREISVCWLDFRKAFRETYPETVPPSR